MQIAIIGRKKDTENYEKFVHLLPAVPLVTLSMGALSACDALLLPGGGDITPAFFGEKNTASRNIDTELDILQFQAIDCALRHHLPILGICKGMQVINVAFGGTILQELPTAVYHQFHGRDQYHPTEIAVDSCLFQLYGKEALVNSTHHQSISTLGNDLNVIQWCSFDHCPEALVHERLPILGLQWHPERLSQSPLSLPKDAPDLREHPVSGAPILSLLSSWVASFSSW